MQRLDEHCAKVFNISRSQAKKYIVNNYIYINEAMINRPNYMVKSSDFVHIEHPQFDMKIIYETKDISIIFKPPGLTVERTQTTPKHEKVLLDYMPEHRIVNRLDKPTSGIMILTKTDTMYFKLKQQFRNHIINKQYRAYFQYPVDFKPERFNIFKCTHDYINFCYDSMNCLCDHSSHNLYESFLEEKYAKTYYEIYENYYSCYPVTGRTHQIRHMMQDLNLPIISIDKQTIGLFSTGIAYKEFA